jgi:hypothetical protein
MALAQNAKKMFSDELDGLEHTQEKMLEVSTLMLIQWRYAKELVSVWGEKLEKARDARTAIKLLYLAHMILEKAHQKRKSNIIDAFADSIGTCIRKVLILDTDDDQLLETKIGKLIRIWKENEILDESTITILENIMGISTKDAMASQDMNAYGDDEDQNREDLIDCKPVKLIPEAEKLSKTLRDLEQESMAAEWLFDDISNLQETIDLMEDSNIKVEKVDDDDEYEEDDDEYVIDLVTASSLLEKWKANLKSRLDRHNETFENIKELKNVLSNLSDDNSKLTNVDELLKEMSPKFTEYSTLHDKCYRKEAELVKKEVAELQKKKREEAKNVAVVTEKKHSVSPSSSGTSSSSSFGGLQQQPQSSMMMPGMGYGFTGGYQQQQQQPYHHHHHQQQQQQYQQRYNNNHFNNGRGQNFNNIASNDLPVARGRGRAMTKPAWMTK